MDTAKTAAANAAAKTVAEPRWDPGEERGTLRNMLALAADLAAPPQPGASFAAALAANLRAVEAHLARFPMVAAAVPHLAHAVPGPLGTATGAAQAQGELAGFVEMALRLLLAVAALHARALAEAADPTVPLLGLDDIKSLRMLAEMVIVLGIQPHLLPGVGVPIDRRLPVATLEPLCALAAKTACDARLLAVLRGIRPLLDSPPLRRDVVPTLLADFLAGLAQLAYAPTTGAMRVSPQDTPASVALRAAEMRDGTETTTTTTTNNRAISEEDRVECAEAVNATLQCFPPQAALETLFTLSGSSVPPPPPWIRKLTSILVPKTLMRPTGVSSLLKLLLRTDTPDTTLQWQMCERLAAMITAFPKQTNFSKSEYFGAICPQVLRILDVKNLVQENILLHQTACMCVSRIADENADVASACLFPALFGPFETFLRHCSDPQDDAKENHVIVEEDELELAITRIHHVISLQHCSPSVLRSIGAVIVPLFRLFCLASRSKSFLRGPVENILSVFFKTCPQDGGAEAFLRILRPLHNALETLAFAPGPTGGALVRYVPSPTTYQYAEEDSDVAVQFLEDLGNTQLVSLVFKLLATEFAAIAGDLDSDESGEAAQKYATLLNVLLKLCDNLGADLMQNVDEALSFLRIMLRVPSDEALLAAMGLLDVLLSGVVTITAAQVAALDDLAPLLAAQKTHPAAAIATMAEDLHISIITRDAKWSSGQKGSGGDKAREERATLDSVLVQLQDPLLPVRAHALVQLKKLVIAKDPAVTRNVSYALALFGANLLDEDSYMYLTAVDGLAALADTFPERVLPQLTDEYMDTKRSIETRLKVGESLMRVARQLNEVLPKYSKYFVPVILRGTKDEDETFRASNLSNLARVCELLRFSIQPFLHELVLCVTSVGRHDPSPQARRGAVHVMTAVLRGLGKDAIHTLSDVLKQIFLFLTEVEEKDPDDVTRVHARNALRELHDIFSEFTKPLKLYS